MKVKIGKYNSFFLSVQNFFLFFTSDKEYANDMTEQFLNTFIGRNLEKYFRNYMDRERDVKINITGDDIVSLDNTLALIIHPIIKVFKEKTYSAPSVENADVPDRLHKPDDLNNWEIDEFHFKRWEYVLNEIEWAFLQKTLDWEDQFYIGSNFNQDAYTTHNKRMQNGFRLFGKYYEHLWI